MDEMLEDGWVNPRSAFSAVERTVDIASEDQ